MCKNKKPNLFSRIKILSDRWIALSGFLVGLGDEGLESLMDSNLCLRDPRLICRSSSPSLTRLLPEKVVNYVFSSISRKRRDKKEGESYSGNRHSPALCTRNNKQVMLLMVKDWLTLKVSRTTDTCMKPMLLHSSGGTLNIYKMIRLDVIAIEEVT